MPKFRVPSVVPTQGLDALGDTLHLKLVRFCRSIQEPSDSSVERDLRRAHLEPRLQRRHHDPSPSILWLIPFVQRVNYGLRGEVPDSLQMLDEAQAGE